MKKYKVAAYLRLSNDDGEKYESNSISSQRTIIEDYIKSHEDMELADTFVDDGYTGTNFNRPGIKKLMFAIEEGRVDCIVVKDLSRFGRDYIDMGNYLERYFPINNIRFIAVNDGYDSDNSSSSDEFMMPLKNVINAHYSKDISKKVKSAFRAKQSKGEFVGAFAGYGYKKDRMDKHKLIVDEEAARIVRRIFQLYNSGIGKIGIVKILNDEKIPCPSEYKKIQGMNYKNSNRLEFTSYWTYATVHRILNNEMYIGHMVQNRYGRKTVRGRARKLNKEQWIIVENQHEPIIDIEVWDTTQKLLQKRTRRLKFDSEIGLFSGFIKCGDCGRAFAKIKRKGIVYYVCGSYKRYSKEICSSHEIREDILEKLILDKLNEEIVKLDEIVVPESSVRETKTNKQPYLIRLDKLYKMKKELYEDYKQGILDKDEYAAYKEDYQREEEMIKGQINSIDNKNDIEQEKNEWIENLKKYKKLERLDRETLACVLDSITIYENDTEKHIDIKLKYMLS